MAAAQKQEEKIWFDLGPILTYNRLFNFIVAERGPGKTFAICEYAVKNFLKTGGKFIYLRRFESELKDMDRLYNPINIEHEDWSVRHVKGQFFVDTTDAEGHIHSQHFGETLALTKGVTKKSTPYNDYNLIFFDEFILTSTYYNYLPNEVELFLDLYETINRLRKENEVRVFFAANALTNYNPYFNYFDIDLKSSSIVKKPQILAYKADNSKFKEAKRKTRFGQLIEGTAYGNYAIENQFRFDENENFIQKHRASDRCFFIFIIHSTSYGIWYNHQEQLFTISYKYDPSCLQTYTFDRADHVPNTILYTRIGVNRQLDILKKLIRRGRIYYESERIKAETISLLYQIAGGAKRGY